MLYRARVLIVGLVLLAAVIVVVMVREALREKEVGPGPTRAGGRVERCLACHDEAKENPGGVHDAEALGCSTCHLGNPLAFDEARAHAGMEPEPGALETVDRTCGREGCHPREAKLVKTSALMATGRGIIAVDRFAFGETASPNGTQTMPQLLAEAHPSPAQDHLRRLCAGCHLWSREDDRDDAIPKGEGVGCSACHAPVRPDGGFAKHPPVAGPVDSKRCVGCHSRSGRISLSYQGLAELQPGHTEGCEELVGLDGGRLGCRKAPDVHEQAGMSCTDCHLHTETMGNGTSYAHAEEQVEITCEACHPPVGEKTTTIWAEVDDPITAAILKLRGQTRPPTERVRTGRRGTPVWNLRPVETQGAPWTLYTKDGARVLPSRPTPADANHRMKGHERLTCVSCHATWAPTCTTCHTRYDPEGRQWSFAAARPVGGAWIETSQGFSARPPTMSVDAAGRVYPAVPGMIMDLDAREAGGTLRAVRFYAPLDPHTTRKEARTCAGCHLDPVAIGLGTGTLEISAKGVRFAPKAPTPEDPARAQDGWTTLYPKEPGQGTREGLRSLDAAEQHRVLRAGACLACHPKADDPVWADFDRSLARLKAGGTACTFPPAPWLFETPPGG